MVVPSGESTGWMQPGARFGCAGWDRAVSHKNANTTNPAMARLEILERGAGL